MLIQANAVHIPLANKSVQLCAFSPPYWGLRKYSVLPMVWGGVDVDCRHEWQPTIEPGGNSTGTTFRRDKKGGRKRGGHQEGYCLHCNAWRGDLGLEPTPELYLAHMMQVMAEVERVLRDDGVCFVNIGDSYAGSHGTGGDPGSKQYTQRGSRSVSTRPATPQDIKPKSLCLIPQKFAIKCQEMGWIIRNEIIWHKPNPMPSSAKDRCTVSHEQVWFMSKSNKVLLWKHRDGRWTYQKPEPDYVWVFNDTDEERLTPPVEADKKNWKRKNLWSGFSYYWDQDAVREQSITNDLRRPYAPGQIDKRGNGHDRGGGQLRKVKIPGGWDIKSGSHGTIHREGRTEKTYQLAKTETTRNIRDVWTIATEPTPEAHFATFPSKLVEPMIRAATKPGDIVLDPFCGTAKTVIEAERLNRIGIGLDLSWEYLAEIAQPRLERPLQKELISTET